MRRALRIGCVKYLNAQPLIYKWDGQVEFDHPAALCRKLAAGQLDVAFVSSFELLERPVYTIVDNVAVGSDGAVCSVFLIHRGAISELEEVILDPASRTSTNLLRCLLAEHGLKPRIVSVSTDGDPKITRTCGRLLIGDQAIRFREKHESDYQFRDLGQWWKETTDLAFVFALWLIRPDVEDAGAIADRLRAQRDNNLRALEQVIAAQTEFDANFCADYFRRCLRFGFADREKEGLQKFRTLCERHGLLPANAKPLQLI